MKPIFLDPNSLNLVVLPVIQYSDADVTNGQWNNRVFISHLHFFRTKIYDLFWLQNAFLYVSLSFQHCLSFTFFYCLLHDSVIFFLLAYIGNYDFHIDAVVGKLLACLVDSLNKNCFIFEWTFSVHSIQFFPMQI